MADLSRSRWRASERRTLGSTDGTPLYKRIGKDARTGQRGGRQLHVAAAAELLRRHHRGEGGGAGGGAGKAGGCVSHGVGGLELGPGRRRQHLVRGALPRRLQEKKESKTNSASSKDSQRTKSMQEGKNRQLLLPVAWSTGLLTRLVTGRGVEPLDTYQRHIFRIQEQPGSTPGLSS